MSTSEQSEEALAAKRSGRLEDRQVFLLTILKPRKSKDAGVYLQASHQAITQKFKDLAAAFRYLENLSQDG